MAVSLSGDDEAELRGYWEQAGRRWHGGRSAGEADVGRSLRHVHRQVRHHLDGQYRRTAGVLSPGRSAAPVARLPARTVPVPPVLYAAERADRLLGGPGDQMRRPRWDPLSTPGAAVALDRGGAAERPDQPLAIRVLLQPTAAAQRAVDVEWLDTCGGLGPPASASSWPVASGHAVSLSKPRSTCAREATWCGSTSRRDHYTATGEREVCPSGPPGRAGCGGVLTTTLWRIQRRVHCRCIHCADRNRHGVAPGHAHSEPDDTRGHDRDPGAGADDPRPE